MKKKSHQKLILQIGTIMICLLPLACLASMFHESETLSKAVLLYCVQCCGFLVYFLFCRKQNRNNSLLLIAVLNSVTFCIVFLSQQVVLGKYQSYIVGSLYDILDYPITFCFKLTICIVVVMGSFRKYYKSKENIALCLSIPTLLFLHLFLPNDALTLFFCILSVFLSLLSIM